MKKILLIAAVSLSFSILVHAKKTEHRHNEAHVHGGATLNMAFDQLNGKIEFKAAAESVLGFEHTAKSDKDKKTLADAVSKFENNMSQMVQFDVNSGCGFTKEKIEMVPEKKDARPTKKKQGQHSDFIANFKIACLKPILGTKVTFDFTSLKNVNDLDIMLLVDHLQKTAEIKSQPVTVELK